MLPITYYHLIEGKFYKTYDTRSQTIRGPSLALGAQNISKKDLTMSIKTKKKEAKSFFTVP